MINYIIAAIAAVLLILVIVLLVVISNYIGSDKRSDERMTDLIMDVRDRQVQSTNELSRSLNDSMMQGFGIMQNTFSEKFDKSLNDRLDNSFKQVSERLESLYKSLGELRNLESGVLNLNKTLSNVKSRGIFGEMQLENILANILDKSQYDVNVATRPRSDERVEFAVKIPDKENTGFIYLPIDSKFPADIYGKILDAAEGGNAAELKDAVRQLRDRIRTEAATIKEKYIWPPETTDFAIMFIPTEGLYSEILRIDGLVEECQNKYKIIISGPTTLTAVLNSLSVGFKYLTVNKKSEEIMRILGNFKVQFAKFDELIGQTQKKLEEAQAKTEALAKRSDIIKNKLGSVEAVDEITEAQDIGAEEA